MNWPVLILGVTAKFLLPLALIPFPFAAGWANFVLDSVDGDLLIPAGLPDPLYQNIDKSADWFTYLCIVVAARRWPIWRLIVALFVFRSVGQAAFVVTQDEFVFFLFPNFLEPVFLVCATILRFRGADAWAFASRHRWVLGALIVLYKMQDEYVTHVANVDRSELIGRLFS
ncbi:MAG: hypothetical protein AB7G21_13615 [Dehalococcoidia bacterium]